MKNKKIAGKKSIEQIKKEKEMSETLLRMKRILKLEEDIHTTMCKLNAQLIELNALNAIENRGAVDIKDYCHHNLYSQQRFEDEYNEIRKVEKEKFYKEHPELMKKTSTENSENQ